jgi:secreted Zn-dependent insulinase-like peptidase
MREIEQQFDSEWVLIDKPETNEVQQVLRGEVVFHSKDRKAIHERVMQMPRPRRIAVLYIGEPPPGTIFLL